MYIKLSFMYCDWSVPHCAAGRMISFSNNPEIIDTLPENIAENMAVNVKLNFDNNGNNEQRELKYDEKLNNNEHVTYDYYIDCQNLSRENIETAIANLLAGFENKHAISHFGEGLEVTALSDDDDDDKCMPLFREGNGLILKMITALGSAKLENTEDARQLSGNLFTLFSIPQNGELCDPSLNAAETNDNDADSPVFFFRTP